MLVPVKHPFFITLILVVIVSACKKGEDDPAFSLRSRKGRLTGEWRLLSGNASITLPGYNEAYVFDGSNVQLTTTTAWPQKGIYRLNLTISKDGTFSFKENLQGNSIDAGGTWSFNTGVGEAKKKEDVFFVIDKVSKGYTDDYFRLFNRFNANFVYSIKELRDKRLVIRSEGKIFSASRRDYATLSTEYIFQQ